MRNKKWTHYVTCKTKVAFSFYPTLREIRVRKEGNYWVNVEKGGIQYNAKTGFGILHPSLKTLESILALDLSTLRKATKEEILQEEIDDLDVRFRREAAKLGDLVLRAKEIERKCEECRRQMEELSAENNRLKKRLGKLKDKGLVDMQVRISEKADEFNAAIHSIEKGGL